MDGTERSASSAGAATFIDWSDAVGGTFAAPGGHVHSPQIPSGEASGLGFGSGYSINIVSSPLEQ